MGFVCIFGAGLISLFSIHLLLFRNTGKVFLSSLIVLTLILLSFQILGTEREIALAWLFILPLIAFYTQRLIWGTVYSVSLILVSLGISYFRFKMHITPAISPGAYIEGAAVFSVITLLTFIYQMSIEKKEGTIFIQYFRDALTSLPNRRKLIQDISRRRENTLILVNIDDFKEINNFIGIAGGDTVLGEIARRLDTFRMISGVTLYRLHADEFALLISGKKDLQTAVNIAEKIYSLVNTDITIEKTAIIVTVSIGISDCHDLLATTDISLKLSKSLKIGYCIYNSEMEISKRYEDNINQLYRIQKGIENNSFIPYFQPIYNIEENRVSKFECLIRLVDDNEILTPDQFLNISMRSKKYPFLTRIMVSKSFEFFKDNDYSFSINLCLEDIINDETTSHIYSELERYGIGHRVIFEFLETERIENNPEVLCFLKRIKRYNCLIAIDDFGTGYSNFDFILRMNFDFLKIDATLIKNVIEDKNARILISTIVKFSRDLGIQTIAEFVATEKIYQKVKELGIDFAQGYYIGKPEEDISVYA
jgi:diguanylate cyclase (GGDEF)-like protein